MAEVGKLNVKITADIKDLQKKLKQSQTLVQAAAKKIGTLSIKMDISSLEKSGKKAATTFNDVISATDSVVTITSGLIDVWGTASSALAPLIAKGLILNKSITLETALTSANSAVRAGGIKLLAMEKSSLVEKYLAQMVESNVITQETAATTLSNVVKAQGVTANFTLGTSFKALGLSINSALGPLGWILIALGAVVTLAAVVLASTNSAAKGFRELKKEIKEAAEETEKNEAATALEIDTLEAKKNRLLELAGTMEKSTAARAEAKMIVDAMNESNDDFNISINETTGILEDEAEVIEASIDAYKARLEQQLATEEYNKLVEQEIQLEKSKEELLDAIEKRYENLAFTGPIAFLASYSALKHNVNMLEDNVDMLEENKQAQDECTASMEAAIEAANEDQIAINQQIDAHAMLEEMYAEEEMTIEDHYAAIEELRNSSYEDAEEQIKEHLEEIKEMEEESQQASLERQQEIEDERKEHLNRLYNLKPSTKTLEEIMEEWTTSEELNNLWNINMEELNELEVPQEFYQNWYDQGAECAEALAACVKLIKEGDYSIIENFGGLVDSANSSTYLDDYIEGLLTYDEKKALETMEYSAANIGEYVNQTINTIPDNLGTEKVVGIFAVDEAALEPTTNESIEIISRQDVELQERLKEVGVGYSTTALDDAAQEALTIDEAGLEATTNESIGIMNRQDMGFQGLFGEMGVGYSTTALDDAAQEALTIDEAGLEATTNESIGIMNRQDMGLQGLFGEMGVGYSTTALDDAAQEALTIDEEVLETATNNSVNTIENNKAVLETAVEQIVNELPKYLLVAQEAMGVIFDEISNIIPQKMFEISEDIQAAFNTIGDLIQEKIIVVSEPIITTVAKVTNIVLETISRSMKNKTEEIFDDIVQVGGMFVLGLAEGLEQYQNKAFARATYIATKVVSIIRSAWDVQSPSKKAIGLSTNFIKGLEIGMGEGDALIEMSGGLAKGMTEQISSTFNSYANTTSTVNQNTYNATYQAATLDSNDVNMADFENRIRRAYA